MCDSDFIHIWQGERKLLPTHQKQSVYELRCLQGCGYLRLMSKANREFIKKGDSVSVAGGEIATVSGNEKMIVELVITKKGKKHDS